MLRHADSPDAVTVGVAASSPVPDAASACLRCPSQSGLQNAPVSPTIAHRRASAATTCAATTHIRAVPEHGTQAAQSLWAAGSSVVIPRPHGVTSVTTVGSGGRGYGSSSTDSSVAAPGSAAQEDTSADRPPPCRPRLGSRDLGSPPRWWSPPKPQPPGLRARASPAPTLTRCHTTSAAGATTASTASSGAAAEGGRPAAGGASVDPREAAKFAALAASWWRSSDGPFAPLHALNPARVRFIRHSLAAALGLDAEAPEPLAGLRVLDVGCGGGILSESLARLGARVHGIDVTRENVEAARLHAERDPRVAQRVRYEVVSAEDLAASGTASYDVVVASEVLEHVSQPHQLLAVLSSLLAPPPQQQPAAAAPPQPGDRVEGGPADGATAAADGGISDAGGGASGGADGGFESGGGGGGALIVSTLNRTPAAWAVAIAGAEYVVRVVPPGTHSWRKFITPEELALMAGACGLQVWHAAGMAPTGPRMAWELTSDLSVNYIATLRPRTLPRVPGSGALGGDEAQAAAGDAQQA